MARYTVTAVDDVERAQLRQLVDTDLALREHQGRDSAGPQLIDAQTGAVICWQCNEPIPAERLAVQPEARLCVDCQTEQEQRASARRKNTG
jgi:RNA polymerase-binding transcription factor DksA